MITKPTMLLLLYVRCYARTFNRAITLRTMFISDPATAVNGNRKHNSVQAKRFLQFRVRH